MYNLMMREISALEITVYRKPRLGGKLVDQLKNLNNK